MDKEDHDAIAKEKVAEEVVGGAQAVGLSDDEGLVELIEGWVAIFMDDLILAHSHVQLAHQHVLGGSGPDSEPVDEVIRVHVDPLRDSVVGQSDEVECCAVVGS